MHNKETIKKMIEEQKQRIENDSNVLERAEIMERFVRRKSLGSVNGKPVEILGQAQEQVRLIKKQIEGHKEFLLFLEELSKE